MKLSEEGKGFLSTLPFGIVIWLAQFVHSSIWQIEVLIVTLPYFTLMVLYVVIIDVVRQYFFPGFPWRNETQIAVLLGVSIPSDVWALITGFITIWNNAVALIPH
jgi:hypothetical protein